MPLSQMGILLQACVMETSTLQNWQLGRVIWCTMRRTDKAGTFAEKQKLPFCYSTVTYSQPRSQSSNVNSTSRKALLNCIQFKLQPWGVQAENPVTKHNYKIAGL